MFVSEGCCDTGNAHEVLICDDIIVDVREWSAYFIEKRRFDREEF